MRSALYALWGCNPSTSQPNVLEADMGCFETLIELFEADRGLVENGPGDMLLACELPMLLLHAGGADTETAADCAATDEQEQGSDGGF